MAPEGSLPCSQEPTTGLRHRSDNSYNHGHPLYFLKIHFHITLFTSRFSKWSFPFRLTYQNCETVYTSHLYYACYMSRSSHPSSTWSLNIKTKKLKTVVSPHYEIFSIFLKYPHNHLTTLLKHHNYSWPSWRQIKFHIHQKVNGKLQFSILQYL